MKNIITISFISLFLNSFSQEIELVKEFISNSVPQDIVEFDGKLFFSADDGINGRELWSSTGTTVGTTLFKDILTGGASNPEKLKVLNGKLYFIALETLSPARKALYVSDGTVNGTIKLTSLSTNSSNITASNYFEACNNLVFFKNDINSSGSELWVTNGTVAGTSMLKDINVGTGGSIPDYFYTYNNKMYFNANNGVVGRELWVTDGTANNTMLVADGLALPNTAEGPRYMIGFDDKVFYEYDGELWATNLTTSVTAIFKQINPSFKSLPKDFIIHQNKLYFSARRNGLANELFVTNGTVNGTLPVLNAMNGYDCANIHVVLGRLMFAGRSDQDGYELWASYGEDVNTKIVKNMNTESTSQVGVDADGIVQKLEMIEANGFAFFPATQFGTTNELFVTDGSEEGTHNLEFVDVINYDGDPNDLTAFHSTMYFGAKYLPNGALYKIAGGTTEIAESKKMNITMFPNPSFGNLTLNNLEVNQNYDVKIYDYLGKLVYNNKNINSNSNQITLKLEPSIYQVKIENCQTHEVLLNKINIIK